MAVDALYLRCQRGVMRAKRTHAARAVTTDDGSPPDATGLTIDWIGVQETGGGGQLLPAWLVASLVGLRAVPFLARRAASRLTGRGRRAGDPREPTRRA
jgi:hypothetical protein